MTKLNLIKKAVKSIRDAAEMHPDDFFSAIKNYGDKLRIPGTVDGLSVIHKKLLELVSQIQDLHISSFCKSF